MKRFQIHTMNANEATIDYRSGAEHRRSRKIGWAASVLLASLYCLGSLEAQSQLTVRLDPPEVVAAGAGWRLLGESIWRDSGVAYDDLPIGQHFLEFKLVDGWIAPERDRPVMIAEGIVTVAFQSYAQIPLYPIGVTATEGGFVEEAAWPPMVFSGLRPFGDSSPSRLNRDWENARRFQSRPMMMPFENFGWRVRLRAMAYPGYQFVGWSGDVTGTRNPLTFIVQKPRQIRAHFARSLASASAIYQGEFCESPGSATIPAQFGYPPGALLERLEWKPDLPMGWKLVAVDGLGGPRAQDGTIFFEGSLGHNPVQLNLHLNVPAGETGRKTIAGEVLYAFKGDAQPTERAIDPWPLTVQPSTAARLELEVVAGRPQLRVEGVIGKTYTLEQTPFFDMADQFWAFMGDLTLTNASQIYVDSLAIHSAIFYRASIVE